MRPSDAIPRVTPGDPAAHPSDGELMRHLDGEPAVPADAGARATVAHLGACAACSERIARMTRRRQRLAALLDSVDPPAPRAPAAEALMAQAKARRSSRRPMLRAAGLLLVAGALAAQPVVRHWVAARRGAASTLEVRSPHAPSSDGSGVRAGATVLSFVPGAGPFTIEFDARPASGTLTIVADSGTRASAERVGGAMLDLVVMPHGLHVRSVTGASASYVVRVPRTVGRVHLRFSDGVKATPDMDVDVTRESSHVARFGPR